MPHPTDTPCLRARLFWLAVIQCHWIAATGVWIAMAGGFPIGHPHWWANRVLPLIVAVYVIVTTLAALRRRWRAMVSLMLCSPIALLAAAVSGRIVFPISGRWASVAVLVTVVVALLGFYREFRRWWPSGKQLAALAVVPLAVGALLPMTQIAPPPSTTPSAAVQRIPATQPLDTSLTTQVITPELRVVPNTGEVMMSFGRRSIYLSPLLTFQSRSPDRCWTNLAPRNLRVGPDRQLCSASPGEFTYLDDGFSRLAIHQMPDQSTQIDATSILPTPVYSHLNSFTELTIFGHRKLSFVFSPAPNTPIDVTLSQYPIGLPTRSAYVDAAGVFHIVQATSGEKGPFHELASGPLGSDDPLSITMLDDGVPFARFTFRDFASQAGRQLSPTAGWGLPVNAIEFTLSDADAGDSSAASIFISLASTGIGRGWDSVGHTAGTYRNRIVVESVTEQQKK